MEPETRYAKSGDLRIAYQVIGEGPDLVMVPGLTSHLEIQWRDPNYRRFVRSFSSSAGWFGSTSLAPGSLTRWPSRRRWISGWPT